MPLVPARCTQCNGILNVDPSKDAAICPHCQTPFITEKVINNYNTTNVTNIGSLHADVVQLSDTHSIDNRVKSGETFIKLGDYAKAQKVFEELIEDCPYDYRSWFGMIKVFSDNFQNTTISRAQLTNIENYYAKAKVVASPEELNIMASACDSYIGTVDQKLQSLASNTSANIQRIVQEKNMAVGAIDAQIAAIEGKISSAQNTVSVIDSITLLLCIAGIVLVFWFFGFWMGVLSVVGAFVVFAVASSFTESYLEKTKAANNAALAAKKHERQMVESKFAAEKNELSNLYNKATLR